jgi:hypothetical protein
MDLTNYEPPSLNITSNKLFSVDKSLPKEEYAFDVWRKLLIAKQTSDALFLVQGKLLKHIRDEKLYKTLDYPSFNQFLCSEELSFSRAKAYSYISIYEYFIQELQLQEEEVAKMNISRLIMMLPILKQMASREQIEEKIEELNAMGHADFVGDVKREKGGSKPTVYWSEEISKWVVNYFPNCTQLITLRDYDQEETVNQSS